MEGPPLSTTVSANSEISPSIPAGEISDVREGLQESMDDGSDTQCNERVFISHRSIDKPLARVVARLFEHLGLPFWFDETDSTAQRAVGLSIVGHQALLEAIEMGIKKSTRMLGIVSDSTRLSWWVPYELGVAHAHKRPTSFLVLTSIQGLNALPEYVQLEANYFSVDELVRWAVGVRQGRVRYSAAAIPEKLIRDLETFMPREPATPKIVTMAHRALAAIDLLSKPSTQEALKLTNDSIFDWLASFGGVIRDISYDLFAPLALLLLYENTMEQRERMLLQRIYSAITQHHLVASVEPPLDYTPTVSGWRNLRYKNPAKYWLQGLSREDLDSRLRLLLTVQTLEGHSRLSTKEEFKAHFDQCCAASDELSRRKLGVLVNPLLGFTPAARPVFWRILAFQQQLYQKFLDECAQEIFEDGIRSTTVGRIFDLTLGTR